VQSIEQERRLELHFERLQLRLRHLRLHLQNAAIRRKIPIEKIGRELLLRAFFVMMRL
jgi:hypothetical protein